MFALRQHEQPEMGVEPPSKAERPEKIVSERERPIKIRPVDPGGSMLKPLTLRYLEQGLGLRDLTLDRATHTLTGRDAAGNTFSAQFKSGDSDHGPIEKGDYLILDRGGDMLTHLDGKKSWFRLEKVDFNFGDDRDDNTGRGLYRLHPEGASFGCVTAETRGDWNKAESFIRNGPTGEVDVDHDSGKRDRLLGVLLVSRQAPRYDRLPYYGILHVK